jgi:hypothetical protein
MARTFGREVWHTKQQLCLLELRAESLHHTKICKIQSNPRGPLPQDLPSRPDINPKPGESAGTTPAENTKRSDYREAMSENTLRELTTKALHILGHTRRTAILELDSRLVVPRMCDMNKPLATCTENVEYQVSLKFEGGMCNTTSNKERAWRDAADIPM